MTDRSKTPPPTGTGADPVPAVLAVWILWGFGIVTIALGTLAVIGHQPVRGQHAVVGSSMPALAVLGAAAAWSARILDTKKSALLAVCSTIAMFGGSILQSFLGERWLYDNGGHSAAPVFLMAALLMLTLGLCLRAPWWSSILGTVVLLVLYVNASFTWDSSSPRGMLLGGAAIGAVSLAVFTAVGAWHHATLRRARTSGPGPGGDVHPTG